MGAGWRPGFPLQSRGSAQRRTPTVGSWLGRRRGAWPCPTAGPSPTTTSATRAGAPVVYLHGTPDSRLGRPADEAAAGAGVRLLAVDRPGFGDSDLDPGATLASLGDDLARLLDEVEVEQAVAARLVGRRPRGARCGHVGSSRATARGVGTDRHAPAGRGLRRSRTCSAPSETVAAPSPRSPARSRPPELAAEVAPYLVPSPIDAAIARAHVLELAGEAGRAELAGVTGAVEALAAGLVASVQEGRQGLAGDIERQLERGLDLHGRRRAPSARSTARSTRSRRRRWAPGSSPACRDAVLDLTPGCGSPPAVPEVAGDPAGPAA